MGKVRYHAPLGSKGERKKSMAGNETNGRNRAGRRDGAPRDARRDQRARERESYTKQVAVRLAAEIDRACDQCRRIEGMPTPVAKTATEDEQPRVPEVCVVDADACAAILENGRGRAQFCDLAVLDFGSYANPAGGFDKGFMGFEQSLCEHSFLYNVLSQQRDWYVENRRRNINCELYRDRALVVPAVRFARDRLHAYADVVVLAAPNVRRARSEYNMSDEQLADAMRERIRFALAIADSLGHEKLIMGAPGCDASGWDASVVAEMLREELASGEHVATKVVFAVKRERFNQNFERMEHAFAAFPAKNENSYEDARARRDAAAQAQVQDDDDDDWRAYLK